MKFTARYLQIKINARNFHIIPTPRLPLNNIAGVFYDWDGTLIEFRGKQFLDSMNEVLCMFGHPRMQSLAGSKSIRDTFAQALKSPTKTEEALEAFRDHFCTHPLSRSNLMPGTECLIKSIKAYGLPQGVISNLDHKILTREIQVLGLSEYFSVVVGSRSDQHLKPSPDLLLEALSSINIVPNQSVLYLGDSSGDIAAARAAGCTSILVGEPIPEVEPNITVANLREVGAIIDNGDHYEFI